MDPTFYLYRKDKKNISKYQYYITLAWATNSPHNAHFYKNFTSYVDGMPILITNKNIEAVNKIIKLIKQHYKIEVTSKTLDKCGDYSIIQLSKQNNKLNL